MSGSSVQMHRSVGSLAAQRVKHLCWFGYLMFIIFHVGKYQAQQPVHQGVSPATDHGAPMTFHCSRTANDWLNQKQNFREVRTHAAP